LSAVVAVRAAATAIAFRFSIQEETRIMFTRRGIWAAAVVSAWLATSTFAASTTVVGFDGGTDGGFTGNAFFEATGGNPGGNAHHLGFLFWNEIRTGGIGEPANPAFLGDYSGFSEVSFGVDIKVDALTDFIGNPIIRPFGIKLIDRDVQGPDGPSGVWYSLADIGSALQPEYTTVDVTIDDTTQEELPAGWIGFGDTDPDTFEPILPAGATFATVLASVDEVHFTGADPRFFFTDANFDVRLDNAFVIVPEPASALLLAFGALALLRRR
jgi:hypothetical protein